MDEYIETEKQLKLQGNSWAVFVKSEAEQLDLKVGSNIGVILCRPEDRNYVHGLLCGSDPFLFYIAVWADKGNKEYEIRKALSEKELSKMLESNPVTILGPFETLSECRRFRDLLEEKQETDPSALKELFREFTN